MFAAGEGAAGIRDAGDGAAAGLVDVVAERAASGAPCSSGVPNALSGSAGCTVIGSATGGGGAGDGAAVDVCAGSGAAPLTGGVQPTGGSTGLLGLAERAGKGDARVNAGSLFVAFQRLQRAGLIKSEWKATENNRRAKYYVLTEQGRKKLRSETREWSRQVAAIARILEA